MEQLVARRAHNPKVVRSSRAPATKKEKPVRFDWLFYFKEPRVAKRIEFLFELYSNYTADLFTKEKSKKIPL